VRFEHDSSLAKDASDLNKGRARDNFRLRRARLDVRGAPMNEVLLRLQADASEAELLLRDAYLELKAGKGVFPFGHFKVPLLEEVLESSSTRWTPERARLPTALFPGERDRGLAYTYQSPSGTVFTAALLSGTRNSLTQDSLTSRKSWLVRLVQPLGDGGKWGKLWLGLMDGVGRRDFGNPLGIANFDRDRQAVGLLLTNGAGLTFRGEWINGKDAGTAADPTVDVQGWYVLLGYKLPNHPITLYAKHDQYDPDRDLAGNTFRRSALGVQYDLNKATRLNLTWEDQQNPQATIWTF